MTLYQQHVQRWISCQRCALRLRRKHVVIARGTVPAPVVFVGEAPGESEDVLGIPFVGPAGHLFDYILNEAITDRTRYAITNLVCCIPKLAPPVVVNLRHEQCDVRVCRGTPWGNPYEISKDGTRQEVIAKFAEWLPQQRVLMKQLDSLTGKRLGCYCKPLTCHGDAIVDLFARTVGSGKVSEPPVWAVEACRPRLAEFLRLCQPRVIIAVGKVAAQHLPVLCSVNLEIIHPAAILRADVSQQGLAIQRTVVKIRDLVDNLVKQQ